MKRHTRTLFLFLGLLTVQPACSSSLTYSAEPIEARVVDADTKQPLDGVVITANWQLFYSTVGGRVPGGQLMVMEAVTDKDGKFVFPAWGPKEVPKYKPQKGDVWLAHIPFLVPDAYLDERDPQLLLFKPGYEYQGLQNSLRSTTDPSPLRRSEWNGKTIEMKRFKGTEEEYSNHLGFMSTSLESLLREECGWKKIPHMILAVNEQSELLRKRGLYALPSIDSLEVRYSNVKTKCGSIKEFFRSYQR